MPISRLLIAVTALTIFASGAADAAAPSDPLRSPGWESIVETFFPQSEILFDDRVEVVMPTRVEDAHDVPMAVKLSAELGHVREIVVIAENNPIQQVARLYPHRPLKAIGLKIRLESTTPVRAAALTDDGVWHVGSTAAEVLTPGGCSVPDNRVADEVSDRLGEIAFKTFDRDDGSARLKFRIIHPMQTGFAVSEDGEYIPAYFLEQMRIGDGDGPVVDIESRAAMAPDPIVTIDVPELGQTIRIQARDSQGLEFETKDADEPSM
ncbi:MAG: quinoprotein dehydrogenase-associated SoxYZ-like carrier [Rhodospirillaceae bacterium]|nr:quinoprotein dehydrogenase-associated SoxYZ-like carrier [Rhodospirillaceae bacterium]